jgi:hypothetical protein
MKLRSDTYTIETTAPTVYRLYTPFQNIRYLMLDGELVISSHFWISLEKGSITIQKEKQS